MIKKDFWKGKKVFLTGHTGFKGTWLSLWLSELGADVSGYSLAPSSKPSLFELAKLGERMTSIIGDIRDFHMLQQAMDRAKPEIVIHMAAQPLVRKSYREPIETYSTNVLGTVHFLEAMRSSASVKVAINVTTDKVYENQDQDIAFQEGDRLGGFDPYSNSKACSELVTSSYRSAFLRELKIKIVTARAGNVIGGGDWSEDRLIPDMIRALENNEAVKIRYPQAVRPWQHVLESLAGYLELAQYLYNVDQDYLDSWNFGPGTLDFMTVGEIAEYVKNELPHLGLKFELGTADLHEAMILKLDNTRSKTHLDWSSRWDSKMAIKKTFEWYEGFLKGEDPCELTLSQIREFSS